MQDSTPKTANTNTQTLHAVTPLPLKPRLALYIPPPTEQPTTKTQTYRFGLVEIREGNDVQTLHCDSYSRSPWKHYADLEFRCYVNPEIQHSKSFGWTMAFLQVHNVDLDRAELMVKTLKKLAKFAEKFTCKPVTFGQYVALNCATLGTVEYVTMVDGKHVFGDLLDIPQVVDKAIAQGSQRVRAAA